MKIKLIDYIPQIGKRFGREAEGRPCRLHGDRFYAWFDKYQKNCKENQNQG